MSYFIARGCFLPGVFRESASAAPSGLFLAISIRMGAATKMEEYVPVITPISIAKAKPFVTSPPTRKRMRMVRKTVRDVITVLGRVSFIALLIISAFVLPRNVRLSSRILSNTITVSFMENPITVRTAAIKCWSISMGKERPPAEKRILPKQ